MRIAPIAPTTAQPTTSNTAVTLTPQMTSADIASTLQVTTGDDSPGATVFRRNGVDLMSLQGVASVQYLRDAPDTLTVTFADDAFMALGNNVIRDVVDGASIVMKSMTPGAPAPLPWWVNSTNQMLASVRAMPGVIDTTSIAEHGLYDVLFDTKNRNVAARLRPLINPNIDRWRVTFLPVG